MRNVLLASGAIALAIASGPALAGDVEAGKAKAAICGACHGIDGNSINPLWPNLAGQHAAYMVKQLKAFKDGSRKDPVMAPQAATLSDEDMENVAAYFAAQKPK